MTVGQTSHKCCEQRIPFGKPMLEAFCMDAEYTNLNARRLFCTYIIYPFRNLQSPH